MSETRIELTGWKAMIVAVIILVVTSYRIRSRFPTVSDDGRKTLREWLVKDYTGRGPRALARRVHDYQAGLPDQPVAAPEAVANVELGSLSAHGWGDALVVPFGISVDGGHPPPGPPIQDFLFTTKV